MLTSVFLHGGVIHIALNMWALFNLGILAEILYGRRNYTILYLLCGLGGSALSIFWHPNQVGIGASGAIFGIAGALLPALKFQKNPRIAAALRGSFSSIGLFVIYNLLFGAAIPFIDNAAHLGGLITGMVAGYFLPSYTIEEERNQTGRTAAVFAIVFGMIVAIAIFAKKAHAG
jgi:rhomboid protease GluP